MTIRHPLATSSWDNAEIEAIQRVIASNQYSMGDEVREFESQFAVWVGSKYALMTNSGSSANLLMTAALRYTRNIDYRLELGDEIIVPAVSWSTTYYPLHQYGLKLRFVDVNLQTLNYDLDALSDAITQQTRAIMCVNLLGNPNNFSVIKDIATKYDLIVIEDNCESMGATFQGKQAGTHGLLGTFSTFFSHHISTMEGGVVVTDDEELYHILLALRAHGWTRNLPDRNLLTGQKSADPFEESFRFVLPGYNLRPLEMSGAIGREQIRKLPSLIAGRRENAKKWQAALVDHPVFLVQQEIGESSWFGFSLIIRDGVDTTRSDVINRISNLGFETRPIVSGNFTKNPVLQLMDHSIHKSMKNAEILDRNGFFIGNHHYDVMEAINVIREFSV